jgi:hypothetical protein
MAFIPVYMLILGFTIVVDFVPEILSKEVRDAFNIYLQKSVLSYPVLM